ncbi:MAG TPA: DMT family transporter [Holophaga sp.]|nr:DMT family transporter [Holophaga sp.]
MGALQLSLFTIFIWSTLTVLIWHVSRLPPFLSTGVALCIGGLAGLVRAREWKIPLRTLALGVGGVFGYHALLFTAIRVAPPVEVNLLQYLWPLFIVVLTPVFLPRTSLHTHHVLGALLGLTGAGLVITGGHLSLDLAGLPGYLMAVAAALTWACFSLLVKRVPPFGSGAVGAFCLVSGLLSLGLFGLERLAAPAAASMLPTRAEWLFLVLLGLGPMGLAFYTWDAALKRGDPRVIGALSYLTPLLSTVNLVLMGGRRLSGISIAAMGLIVAGAVLGSLDLFRRKTPA